MPTGLPKIIDISHWQGTPDFAKVRAQGIIACIMKATEGVSYKDSTCAPNTIAAQKQGIACATYHWLKPARFASAEAQMKFYLQTIDPVPGERVIIDYEENGCQLIDLLAAVRYLKADPRGLRVTVYSGHLLKEQLNAGRNQYLAENTDLWLAQYTTGTPSWPASTWPQWTLWQYSESGKLDGIVGAAVDFNQFNGTDADLLRWINPLPAERSEGVPASSPQAGGAQAPLPDPKEQAAIADNLKIVDITLPPGVTARINGKLV